MAAEAHGMHVSLEQSDGVVVFEAALDVQMCPGPFF
jgi:hypothetical protein